jgi:N-acetyl-alpha-D-glucosaminyl L-malate synthase BshA
MKIAISCHPTQGGSGVVATELAMGFSRRGHEVHLISDDPPFRLPAGTNVQFHKVNVPDYPLFKYPPHGLSLANEIAEVVVKHEIDIVHAHYAVPHAISSIIAAQVVKPYPLRVVTTLHGTDITLVGSHRDFYRICRYAMVECDAVTAVSSWLVDQTMNEFKLPTPPFHIPNFVDCERFQSAGRVGFPKAGEPFQILHASNFRPVKRVIDIVRVFERIQRKLPARLVMVGDGPELGLAKELAAQLRIGKKVDFLGPRVDIEHLYRQSHLFLLLSEYESFGLSALEALACGTPVIASRSGGLTEVVQDGTTGYLCDVGAIDQIAGRAVEALSDEQAWTNMSDAGRIDARQRYCKEMILPMYETLYRQVMAATPKVLASTET